MPTEYEPLPGLMWHHGEQFSCPVCGCKEFKIEVGSDPPRFWCDCPQAYTEEMLFVMDQEKAAKSVEQSG